MCSESGRRGFIKMSNIMVKKNTREFVSKICIYCKIYFIRKRFLLQSVVKNKYISFYKIMKKIKVCVYESYKSLFLLQT